MVYRVACLTVSDSAADNTKLDKSGPALVQIFEKLPNYKVTLANISADSDSEIQENILEWTGGGESNRPDVIFTVGGTGFGQRDRTPEAISSLLERHAPGIVHLLLSSSISHTPFAALSRPVAGTIGKTLVITLPGSTKAVKENIEALLPVLEHALSLIKGGSGDDVHKVLQGAEGDRHREVRDVNDRESNHSYRHGHVHEAPKPHTSSSGVPLAAQARHRKSPYPIITYDEALSLISQKCPMLEVASRPVNTSLPGHILAQDVHAMYDIPRFKTTNVDGYALRSSDPPGKYNVVTSRTHDRTKELAPNSIHQINTGAALPEGTDGVLMVEGTVLISSNDRDEEEVVQTLSRIKVGENVRAIGSDLMKDERILEKGDLIGGAGEVGTLTFAGVRKVEVYRKPVVAIMSTGDELIDLNDPDESKDTTGGPYDTNRPSLKIMLEGLGYKVVDLGIAQDTIEKHTYSIQDGLDRADVIISTGGTSMGSTDLLKPIIEAASEHFRGWKSTIHFGRVGIKPGKPTTFATLEGPEQKKRVVWGLPGNPASMGVTFWIFVLPTLRKMGGWPAAKCSLPKLSVELLDNLYLDESRLEFHRVRIRTPSKIGGHLTAESTGGQRSSRQGSFAGANGLVIVSPAKEKDVGKLEKGMVVEAMLFGDLLPPT